MIYNDVRLSISKLRPLGFSSPPDKSMGQVGDHITKHFATKAQASPHKYSEALPISKHLATK